MFRYWIYTLDGDELGDGSYLAPIRPGERIHIRRGETVIAAASGRSRSLRTPL